MCLENFKFLCGTGDNTEIKRRPWETPLDYHAKHFYLLKKYIDSYLELKDGQDISNGKKLPAGIPLYT